ncbi:MAG TPA: Gfo/Idh/MocA family oxidoreductase [Solirubrobacteraceae bacterium]
MLIAVDLAVPLLRLDNASARVMRHPRRKVMTFLRTDGPRSTLRKAKAKREETLYTGDLHVTLILGRAIPSGKRLLALASRVPPAAQQTPVHRDLTREVSEELGAEQLLRIASILAARQQLLADIARQSFLYSEMAPPAELTSCLEEAIDRCGTAHSYPPNGSAVPGLGPGSSLEPDRGAAPKDSQMRDHSLAPIAPPQRSEKAADTVLRVGQPTRSSGTPVALLGGGDYARTEIIPALRAAGLTLHTIANREPQVAAMLANERGFAVAASDPERAIAELPQPGLVVIATAHDSHARLARAAVDHGHRAFVEKPPAVTQADVQLLVQALIAHPGAIEVGFNRRYHPLVRETRARLQREQGPVSIMCTIKEIPLAPDHWYLWPNQGTRITGNLCHWIDLAVFLLEGRALPVSVTLSPQVSHSARSIDEERVLTVTFADGSLLCILATGRGDDIRGVQEQIEIRRGHTTVTIDDLWKMRVRHGGVDRRSRMLFRHKAHADMYRTALRRFLRGEPALYPAGDIVVVSAIQIAATELARSDRVHGEIPTWLESTLHTLASLEGKP